MNKIAAALVALTPTALFFTLTSERPRLYTLLTVAIVGGIIAILTRKPEAIEHTVNPPEFSVVDPSGVPHAWCATNLDAMRVKYRLDKITRTTHAIVHTPKENLNDR